MMRAFRSRKCGSGKRWLAVPADRSDGQACLFMAETVYPVWPSVNHTVTFRDMGACCGILRTSSYRMLPGLVGYSDDRDRAIPGPRI